MTPVHVIILAQGQQTRLPSLTVPKQMLELPACSVRSPITILERTLLQLGCAMPERDIDGVIHVDVHVTVVCARPLAEHVVKVRDDIRRLMKCEFPIGYVELAEPGNSSLKGISTFLELLHAQSLPFLLADAKPPERTVVLLGDVVYSWEVLEALVGHRRGMKVEGEVYTFGFCGSADLSPSGGELWGLWWTPWSEARMMLALHNAIHEHPPFTEYQPGQLRRWLWAMDDMLEFRVRRGDEDAVHKGPGFRRVPPRDEPWFVASRHNDYTRDIDIPVHLELLGRLSESAAADDKEHGIVW